MYDECHDGQPDGVHGPAARGSLRQVKILLRGIDDGIYSVQGTTDMPSFRKLTQQLSFRVFILRESHYTDFEISSPQTVFADHCALVIGWRQLVDKQPNVMRHNLGN